MSLVLDVESHLGGLLEPTSAVTKKALDRAPSLWEAQHLYLFPVRVDEETFETGPTRLQRFELMAVYVTDDVEMEGASLEWTTPVATVMDNKRGDYMRIVRTNSHNAVWEHLTARIDEWTPRAFDKRSAAVRVSGWRIVN